MKFQNCILINFVTDGRTHKLKTICPFNFSKSWGHKYRSHILEVSNYDDKIELPTNNFLAIYLKYWHFLKTFAIAI